MRVNVVEGLVGQMVCLANVRRYEVVRLAKVWLNGFNEGAVALAGERDGLLANWDGLEGLNGVGDYGI
jgi:hypothetical protein